ncbi:hypothetical protein [Planctomyces sp. SH-PL62]|uniref:hypothetical protein n=1 Tax=Planctomyces sp. SH-PL62 TaxID=1636152 RepID=UPI00078CF92D|nr:hypothetical protein [Planctomyces sp. SH-PL62]AMV38513.1 hypothetical protein VT85_13840 [Planctomyces sp. SH-PL62]
MAEEPKHPNDPDRVHLRDWLGLARAVPAAFDVRKLLLAAVGLLVLEAGWSAIGRLAPDPHLDSPRVLGFASLYGELFEPPGAFVEALRRPAWNLTRPVRLLVEPLSAIFAIDGLGGDVLSSLGRLVLAVVVMGVVGGAICRLAVAEAGTGDRAGLRESLGFAFRNAWGLSAAPLYPLAIVLLLGGASAGFGLVARFLPSLTAALFAVPMLLGLTSAAFLVLAIATWPLIHAAIAAESEEAVEAIGRTYGYVKHRPMTLAACVAAAWALGTLGLAAFEVFLWAGMHLGVWGMGLAAFPSRPGAIGGEIEAWTAVVGLALQAWTFAFFWSAAVRAYLLFRQDVDGGLRPGIATTAGEAGGSAALR